MSDVYPGIDDWDRQALDVIPGAVRAGAGSAVHLGMVLPLAGIETDLEGLAREIADIEIASLYVARMKCLRHGINPGGMVLHEVRRLASGATAGLASDGTDARLRAMWAALCGSTNVSVRNLRSNTTANYAKVFIGRIGFEPSRQWLTQAGRIVARAVEAGSEVEASVHLGGEFRFGASPGLSAGVLSFQLPVI
jgi:hypothetical protein